MVQQHSFAKFTAWQNRYFALADVLARRSPHAKRGVCVARFFARCVWRWVLQFHLE